MARITSQHSEGPLLTWSSDATPAYSLVNADVKSAVRSVAMSTELPFVLIADRVVKATTPSKIQARFFIDNKDGHASGVAAEGQFTITRPGAILVGKSAMADGAPASRVGKEDAGDMSEVYPFVEIESGESLIPVFLTVLVPLKTGESAPEISIEPTGELVWKVTITKGPQSTIIEADLAVNEPTISLVR